MFCISQTVYNIISQPISIEYGMVHSLTLTGPAFSVVRQGQGALRGPDAKNEGQHQPIEMKLCMCHHTRIKSIPDAKFESGSSSSFEDITSHNFPQKKGTSHKIRLFTPGKRV